VGERGRRVQEFSTHGAENKNARVTGGAVHVAPERERERARERARESERERERARERAKARARENLY